MQSGLVDILISLTNPLSTYSLATDNKLFCISTSIAVKLPPKNAISTLASLSIVVKYSSTIFFTSSLVMSVLTPVIFF